MSFAMAGPDTRTTQIFVNLEDNARLDKSGFAPFGTIVAGMDVFTALLNPTPHSGNGVDQGAYQEQGNAWILNEYPEIDLIENTALFVGEVDLQPSTTTTQPP
jgi:peptidyl-prolyl cis-trans isomerase A (cyclophilin A)